MNTCNYSMVVWIAVSFYVDGIPTGNLLFLAFYIEVFTSFCFLCNVKDKWFTPLIRKPVYVPKGA